MNNIGNVKLESYKPKLLTHVGVTYDISTPDEELNKAIVAISNGADIIADASLGEKSLETLTLLCHNLECPVTCLPGYILATQKGGNELPHNLSKCELLETTEKIFSIGAKGITIHPMIDRRLISKINKSNRVFPFTSRMGNYIRRYLEYNIDNPFYKYFPEIVDLAKKYNANISLGVSTRSPSVVNNGGFDDLFKTEIDTSRELIKICNDNDVSVTLEAGGHITIDKMPEWYNYIKNQCYDVPLRVLVVSTDRGMGHDNVSGAISAAYLARLGVELICTVTRAEHISQPTIDDIRESVIHYKIALASALPNMKKETLVADARAVGGCHLPNVIKNVIDPQGAAKAVKERSKMGLNEDSFDYELATCTMCGASCPLKYNR